MMRIGINQTAFTEKLHKELKISLFDTFCIWINCPKSRTTAKNMVNLILISIKEHYITPS